MKNIILPLLVMCSMAVFGCSISKAQAQNPVYDKNSSADLTMSAWEALDAAKYDEVMALTDKCIQLYSIEALKQQASLADFPDTNSTSRYQFLNDVATCYFIRGKALWAQGKLQEAKGEFEIVIDKYTFGQSWDPKGWYWKVSEVAQGDMAKIDVEIQSGESAK